MRRTARHSIPVRTADFLLQVLTAHKNRECTEAEPSLSLPTLFSNRPIQQPAIYPVARAENLTRPVFSLPQN